MTTLTIENSAAECRPLGGVVRMQSTLAGSVTLCGLGLHSGCQASVTVHPAEENTGIVFESGGRRVPALAANVVDTSRGTSVGLDGVRVRTIEHIMAALRGTGVDNALVEVSGCELPILDGSAAPYCEAFESVGFRELSAPRDVIELSEPICVQQNGSFILAVPADELRISYVMNYNHPLIGAQTGTYVFREWDFSQEIAPARTFVLYEEVAELLDNNLARGGSFDNAIVLWQDRMSSSLRFPDELVRHKMMDLIGDLALAGAEIRAEIVAVKSGHTLNVEFVRKLTEPAPPVHGAES